MSHVATAWFVAVLYLFSPINQPKENAQNYIEIDCSMLPRDGDGKYKIQLSIWTTDKDITLSEPAQFGRKEGDPANNCAALAIFLTTNRWKAEVVDKTKLRVYGRIFNDMLIPVTKGAVESADLRPEELPRVTFVGKKG